MNFRHRAFDEGHGAASTRRKLERLEAHNDTLSKDISYLQAKYNALSQEMNKLQECFEQWYYSPGMPGFAEAERHFRQETDINTSVCL